MAEMKSKHPWQLSANQRQANTQTHWQATISVPKLQVSMNADIQFHRMESNSSVQNKKRYELGTGIKQGEGGGRTGL